MFYDGGCPLCRREVDHYRRVDRAGNVDWIDIDQRPDTLQRYGIELTDAMRHLHVIDANGAIHCGAYAFSVVWAQLPYYRRLNQFLSALRVFGPLNWAYLKFADYRFKKRGFCSVDHC